MAIDAPTFPGEKLVSLAGATITSAYCRDRSNALDDDSATYARFIPIVNFTVDVPLNQPAWIDSTITVAPGAAISILASGNGNTGPSSGNLPVTPAGATPPQGFVGSGESYGFYTAKNTRPLNPPVTYGLVIVPVADGDGAPIGRPYMGGDAFCPGTEDYLYVNGSGVPQRLWLQFNGLGNFYSEYTGSFAVVFNTPNRYIAPGKRKTLMHDPSLHNGGMYKRIDQGGTGFGWDGNGPRSDAGEPKNSPPNQNYTVNTGWYVHNAAYFCVGATTNLADPGQIPSDNGWDVQVYGSGAGKLLCRVTVPLGTPPGQYVAYQNTNIGGSDNTFDYYYFVFQVGDPPPGDIDPFGRFLRVDIGVDKFLTRVRLRMAGAGTPNAAIALESGLEDDADVPVPYIPLPSDETTGTGVDEIVFDPPFLARGVVFYPDFLSTLAEDTGIIDLFQLQIYESEYGLSGEEIMGNPTQTTVKRSRVGVKNVKVYPWNGVTGPYDATTMSTLEGIQSLDVTENITVAKVLGSETPHPLGAHVTAREGKYKVSAAESDLRILALLTGDKLIVNPPSGSLGEVQYLTAEIDGRAPYFRMTSLSTNGEGADTFAFLKCKVEGNISYNLTKDGVTNLEFEFCTYWDTTYVRLDGTTGGVIERLFGANGEVAMHS